SALAKRNFFRNLTGSNPDLASREAWRLVDFLEGEGGDGRLSAHARAGLRVTELDRRLAALRASGQWKDAARGLRRALDSRHGHPPAPEMPAEGPARANHEPPVADRSAKAGPAASSAGGW